MTTHRFPFLTLALATTMCVSAQPPHVDSAFRALLDANSAPTSTLARTTFANQTKKTYADENGVMHQSERFSADFLIPAEQRSLIDDLYAAVAADADVCTQLEWQDAHSAHTWSYTVNLPGNGIRISTDEHTNLLFGGFIDATATPTTYHYYVLTWKVAPEGGRIGGRLHHYTMDAQTQHPHILQPSRASFAALTDAFYAFAEDSPELTVSRSLHWSRVAATGRWISMYNTWGFRAPLSEESRLLSPLCKAFEAERGRAYRYLNKPAGETAESVSIILNDNGANLGLGSQTDWNILYAYFNDEDFPENRYVYALWWKADVARQQIVGELFIINTERPGGGIIRNPFVQTTVPAYLWQMGSTPTSASQLTAYEATIRPLPSLTTRDEDVIQLPTLTDDSINAELRTMHSILAPVGRLFRAGREDVTYDACNEVKKRGLDLNALENEANAEALNFSICKHLYLQDLQIYSDAYSDITRTLKEEFETRWAEIKINVQGVTDEGQLSVYRSSLNNLASSYTTELQRASADYTANLDTLRRQRDGTMSFFTADGRPGRFVKDLQNLLIAAYRSDGSLTDAYVAAKLRQLAIFAASMANADEQRALRQRLALLRSTSEGTLADEALADAIVRLGGEQGTEGVRTARDFDRRFRRDYADAKSTIKRMARHPQDYAYAVTYHLRRLSALCQDSAPLASNPAACVQQLTDLRRQLLAAANRVPIDKGIPYDKGFHIDNGLLVNLLSLIDRAIEALNPSTAHAATAQSTLNLSQKEEP